MEETTMEVVASNYVPLSYVYASRYGEGRTAVPVLKSEALYANFAHVAGVAAEAGDAAFSIDKLRILDVLIGELQSAKSDPLPAAASASHMSSGHIDALIQQYGAEVHALTMAPTQPYVPKATVPSGSLFSMAA
jgi:hypothetical protein